MNLWLHSPWLSANLERLGWTLLHFLWQGALVAILLGLELIVLRRASARLRYLAAVVAAATAWLMPLITFSVLHPTAAGPASPVAVRSESSSVPSAAVAPTSPGTAAGLPLSPGPVLQPPLLRSSPRMPFPPASLSNGPLQGNVQRFSTRLRSALPWCVSAWVLGVVVLSIRLLVGWRATQKLCRRGTRPASPHWQESLERVARKLGIHRVVRLLESTLAEVPAVIGILRPVILLPVGMLTGLSVAQVEMILAHELAHVRRQDYLVNLGLTLFETLGFYHPAVWWIAARVREEREHACDDLAVQASGVDSVEYARALALLEELREPAAGFALAATSGGNGNLLKRVRRMLGMAPPPVADTGRIAGWLAGVLALGLVGVLTLSAPPHRARAQGIAPAPPVPLTLRGQVKNTYGNSLPLTGTATVRLLAVQPDDGQSLLGGSLSEDGSFRVDYAKAGWRARLVVNVPGYRPWLSPEFTVEEHPAPLDVTLEQEHGILVWGNVSDAGGRRIGGAVIQATVFTAGGLTYPLSLGDDNSASVDTFAGSEGGFNTSERLPLGGTFILTAYVDGKPVASSGRLQSKDGHNFPANLTADNLLRFPAPISVLAIGPGDLAGHVTDAQGSPVAEATVSVHGPWHRLTTKTDAAGRYVFRGFNSRPYENLEVEKEWFATSWVTDLTTGRNFTTALGNVTRLRGQILKPDGSPAGPTALTLVTSRPARRVPGGEISGLRLEHRTDEHGAYDFPLEPGVYQVEVTAEDGGLVARYDQLQVVAGKIDPLPATVAAGVTLRVRAVDSLTGQPVPDTLFTTWNGIQNNSPGSTQKTDAQGFARWDHLPAGDTHLSVQPAPAYIRCWTTDRRVKSPVQPPGETPLVGWQGLDHGFLVELPVPDTDRPITVIVERGVKITGHVLDPDGNPVADAMVRALVSDPDDMFPSDGHRPSLAFYLNATPGGRFGGYVAAGNGEPTRFTALAVTNATLGGGVSEPFDSRPGDEREVTIRLPKGGSVEGSVVDAAGRPRVNAEVYAVSQDHFDSEAFTPNARTDARGHFRFNPMRPAEYVVQTVAPRWSERAGPPAREVRRVTVRSGGTVDVGALNLEPDETATAAAIPAPLVPTTGPGELTGHVVDEQGKPVAGATVYDEAGNDGSDKGLATPAITDAGGAFHVPKLRQRMQWRRLATRLGDEAVGWLDIGSDRQPAIVNADNIITQPLRLRPRRYQLRGVCVDENDQPVAGAEVAVHAVPVENGNDFMLTPGHPEQTTTQFWAALATTSDARGNFLLAVPLDSGLYVDITAPGRESVHPQAIKAGDVGRVTLKAAGAIAGRIVRVNADGGTELLPNASLLAVGAEELRTAGPLGPPEHMNRPASDDHGRYRIEHLPPDTYTVLLSGFDGEIYRPEVPPTTLVARENVVVRAGETTTLDLQAVSGRRLRVKAVDPDTNRPVGGLNVDCEGPSRPVAAGRVGNAALSPEGEWTFDVAPGHYRVYLTHSSILPSPELASAAVDVPADRAPDPVILKVAEGLHLRGRVRDAAGKPIPLDTLATVRLLEISPHLNHAQSGSQSSGGTFDIVPEEAGIHARLAVDVPGYRPYLSPEFVLAERPEPLTITLAESPAFSLRGRVLDQDGHPVGHANVLGRVLPAEGLSYVVRLGSGVPDDELYTDQDGWFETRRMQGGSKLVLEAFADGQQVSTSHGTTFPGSQSGRFDLDMHAVPTMRPPTPDAPISPRDLAGHVVDGRGNPVAGALVTVSGTNSSLDPGAATTNAAGGFRFPDFGDRHYVYLAVEKDGYAIHWVTDLAVGRDFALPLDDATRLRGQLIKADGSPAGPTQVVLRTTRPTQRPFMMNPIQDLRVDRQTDAQGRYDFPVEAGEYGVEITSADGSLVAGHEDIQVAAGQVTALPAVLDAGLTLRVQTVDRGTGQPAPGVKFYIAEMKKAGELGTRPGSEKQTDDRGFVQWDHLFPGTIDLCTRGNTVYQRVWSADNRVTYPEKFPGQIPVGNRGIIGQSILRLVPGQTEKPILMQVERGVKISGRVIDSRGQPVMNAEVRAINDPSKQDPADGAMKGDLVSLWVFAGADGRFNSFLPAGNGLPARLDVYGQSKRLGTGLSEPFDTAPGDEREVNVTLPDPGWIEGSVVDAEGKPVSNIGVTAYALGVRESSLFDPYAKTDPQGRFSFRALRPAEYEVRTTTVPQSSVGDEPPQEHRRIMVKAGQHAQVDVLHYLLVGWTTPPPAAAPPAAAAAPVAAATTPPPAPPAEMLSARVKIVDEAGQPIAGATVTPDGYRPRGESGGHYSWSAAKLGPPPPAVTDAAGVAVVSYPRNVEPGLRTGAISFRAEHPDFCAVRPTDYRVDAPGEPGPVTLRRGAALRVSGHLPGSKEHVPVYPQQDDPTHTSLSPNNWQDAGDNVLTTRRLPVGRNYLRLAHAAPDGTLSFSETRLLPAVAGEMYTLDLELRPGTRVEGHLDAAVPRPVRGGRVVIRAYATSPESDASWIDWNSWREVAPDGTFVFESLPPGKLEITALCEGYTSAGLPDARFGGSLHFPQHFDLVDASVPVEIKMQAAAACTVQVRDTAGAPVGGARVAFAPSVHWTPNLSTFFCMPILKMEEWITSRREITLTKDWFDYNPFTVITDARGNATIRNLPPLAGVTFGVDHEGYESFPSRNPSGDARSRREQTDRVNLVPGAPVTAAVRLEKKGPSPVSEESAAAEPTPGLTPVVPTPRPRRPEESSANVALSVLPAGGAGTFSGRLVDEEGKGLSGVLVDAWTWHPGNETTTDAAGNFRLTGLDPHREIEVRFSKEGYTPRLVARQPLGTLEQPLMLTTHTWFEGTVAGPDGQPSAGAFIRANQGPKEADGVFIDTIWTETHADARGHYRLYAQADRYDVQVTTKEGNVARLPDTDLADGQARRLDITVQSGVVFRARVVDSESGAPVAGVKLSNREHPGIEGVSAPDGTLDIRGLLPGKFQFQVAAEGYTRWWSEQCSEAWSLFQPESNAGTRWQRNFDSLDFDLQTNQPPVTITVERGVRLRGRALDPDGQPVSGATVAPARTGSGNSITGDTRFSVPTGADGTFEMLLPASKDAEYNLIVHDGKYGEWRRWANGALPPFRTRPGQTLQGVEIRLSRPAVVRGRATDAVGKPIAGSSVRGAAADGSGNRYYDPETTTDPDGRFELRFLSPGREIISLQETGIQTAVEASAEQAVDDVQLRPPGAAGPPATLPSPSPAEPAAADPTASGDLRGSIRDTDHHPVPGAEVVLVGRTDGEHTMYSGAMPGPVESRVTTDAQGRFVLRHADPAQEYTVWVSASGFSRTNFPGLKTSVANELLLRPAVVVTGRVLAAGGIPAAGFMVHLIQNDRAIMDDHGKIIYVDLYETTTDAAGRFRFDRVAPKERYDLFGEMNQPGPGDVLPVRLVAAGDNGSVLEVGDCPLTHGARVSGHIALSDGAPLPPGSTLSLGREHGWADQLVNPSPDGSFTFEGIPSESVRFKAKVKGYDVLTERVQHEMRNYLDMMLNNPPQELKDGQAYDRSRQNWALQVEGDRSGVDLLLHSDAAIQAWLEAQVPSWIRKVDALYPQGAAGLDFKELHDLAMQAREMVLPPANSADPAPPITWRFVMSSEQPETLADLGRRAEALGFRVHSVRPLADTEDFKQFATLRHAPVPRQDKSLALELRLTETPTAESLFRHELALRQLMHESKGFEWRLTGRVLRD